VPEFVVRIEEAPPAKAVLHLYKVAGFFEGPDDEAMVEAIVRGSACFASAYVGGELVGMGRVISDGVSDAYIQDIMVLPEWRGHGIGSALVGLLLDWCLDRGISWVGLVAVAEAAGLYRRLGFTVLEGHVPMLFKADSGEP